MAKKNSVRKDSNSVHYVTWNDVGIPGYLVDQIKVTRCNAAIDYLVLNRLLRYRIKPQYFYRCERCKHGHRTSRLMEEYTICENCNSSAIVATPMWRMGKDNVKVKYCSGTNYVTAISQMPFLYRQYYNVNPPPSHEFLQVNLTLDWSKCTLMPKKQEINNYGDYAYIDRYSSVNAVFKAKFICGEEVIGTDYNITLIKAAILCPFLWDDRFDWRTLTRKDVASETPLIPLLHLLHQYNSSSDSKFSLKKSVVPKPYAQILEEANPAPVNINAEPNPEWNENFIQQAPVNYNQ